MSSSAINGEVLLDRRGYSDIFVGATGTGEFPPTGEVYQYLGFRPRKDEGGIVVFKSNHSGSPQYSFWQYEWRGGKVYVDYGVSNFSRAFSIREDLGILVKVKGARFDWYYVTDPQKVQAMNCKVVDPVTIMRYVDGKIGLRDLDRNARSLEREKEYHLRVSAMQAEAEQKVAARDRTIAVLTLVVDGKRTAIKELLNAIENATALLSKVATACKGRWPLMWKSTVMEILEQKQ